MLSAFLAAIGLGAIGLGLGLLVQGPLALDRRTTRQRSDSSWVKDETALDLHADRHLGALDSTADEVWRPLVSLHFWTVGAVGFGCTGLATYAVPLPEVAAWGVAGVGGAAIGYAVARTLRALPPRPQA